MHGNRWPHPSGTCIHVPGSQSHLASATNRMEKASGSHQPTNSRYGRTTARSSRTLVSVGSPFHTHRHFSPSGLDAATASRSKVAWAHAVFSCAWLARGRADRTVGQAMAETGPRRGRDSCGDRSKQRSQRWRRGVYRTSSSPLPSDGADRGGGGRAASNTSSEFSSVAIAYFRSDLFVRLGFLK